MLGLLTAVFISGAAIVALLLVITLVSRPLTFFQILAFLEFYASVIVAGAALVLMALIWAGVVELKRRATQRSKDTDPSAP